MKVQADINGLHLECVQGDIANQPDLDAVVNAANAQLAPGGGVAGAIHKAAGPKLFELCKPLAPINSGQAVITPAANLPNKYVIHCLGPVFGVDMPSDLILANCYKNALRLCEENQIQSIGFCAISAGVFGYPLKEALEAAFTTIADTSPNLKHLNKVRLVLYSNSYLSVAETVLNQTLNAY